MQRSGERLTEVAAVVAGAALGLAAGTAVMITWRYRPDGGFFGVPPQPSARWSRQLVDVHALSLAIALVAVVVWCGLIVATRRWRSRPAAVAVGSTIGTLGVLALSVAAWHRARFDQLGLWAVTVGSDVSGLWYAAFSDKVRFMFVSGSGERSQSDVAPWVVVYLVAPFVALGLFAIGWITTRPPRTARRTVVVAPAPSPAE